MITSEIDPELIIEENRQLQIENYQLKILSYIGLVFDVHHFKVKFQANSEENLGQLGLLRVGSLESGLKRELDLREKLQDYGMIAKILAIFQSNSVLINSSASVLNLDSQPTIEAQEDQLTITLDIEQNSPESIELTPEITNNNLSSQESNETESEHLEEEEYPQKELYSDTSQPQILLLTEYPEQSLTLETWLKEEHSPEEILSLVIQICQCFSYIFQQEWCLINLNTQMIEISQPGKPLKLFDLTNAYPLNYIPTSGLSGDYYAPELALANPIQEVMSSYTIGALLYQAFHQKLPRNDQPMSIKINPIPRIYQILKITLSPLAEERFPLAQLRNLLVETRKAFRQVKIQWNVASCSTVGLSTERLQNEDNYGVKQQQLSNYDTLLLGIVADGMGGMAQGEVASQIAVETFLKEPIPEDFAIAEQRNTWLLNLCQKANQLISENVQDGGTTLSVVLAINDSLMIAHIGDSRIYRLQQGEIQQLSEDHSLVAMLVANGEITEEESLEHPDRNVLLKSLGSKRNLSNGYVQTLNRTMNELSIKLENEDILLLCSDGVWDLVSKLELSDIFTHFTSLQSAVDQAIQKVIEKGASDNATLLALQCQITSTY